MRTRTSNIGHIANSRQTAKAWLSMIDMTSFALSHMSDDMLITVSGIAVRKTSLTTFKNSLHVLLRAWEKITPCSVYESEDERASTIEIFE